MDVTLIAVFEEVSAEEGAGYTAYVEGFPEAIAEGDTLIDARESLVMAVEYVLQTDPAFVERLLDRNDRPAEPAQPGARIIREKIKVWVA